MFQQTWQILRNSTNRFKFYYYLNSTEQEITRSSNSFCEFYYIYHFFHMCLPLSHVQLKKMFKMSAFCPDAGSKTFAPLGNSVVDDNSGSFCSTHPADAASVRHHRVSAFDTRVAAWLPILHSRQDWGRGCSVPEIWSYKVRRFWLKELNSVTCTVCWRVVLLENVKVSR